MKYLIPLIIGAAAAYIIFSQSGPGSGPNWPVASGPQAPKATLVEFGAEWCAPCKAMKPILDQLKREFTGQADVVTVDIDQNRDLAIRHGVKLIPVLFIYDKNGREKKRLEGMVSKTELTRLLNETIQGS